jgi:probable O-glycosylation ligase (exosortase A-associated)
MIFGPPNSRMYDNNDLALALNMVLPLMIFFARTWGTRRGRLIWAGVAGSTVLAVLFTYSRGGVVALAAVLGVLLLRSRQRLPALVAVVAVLVVAMVFAPPAWVDRVSSITDYEEDSSVNGRFNSWAFAWNLALARPLVGGGFGTFTPDLFQVYAPDPDTVVVAHSIYFDMLATQGFVGLLLFLSLLLTSLWRAERLRRRSLRCGAVWFAGCAEALQLSVIAFMVGGAFLSQSWHEIFYHFVAALVLAEVLAQPVLAAEIVEPAPLWEREATPCAA